MVLSKINFAYLDEVTDDPKVRALMMLLPSLSVEAAEDRVDAVFTVAKAAGRSFDDVWDEYRRCVILESLTHNEALDHVRRRSRARKNAKMGRRRANHR